MIPLRVTMSGWMRYRDEQTADFTGARLIAIVGDNGAGKSSIFDAMTFALYGSHRLGRQNTAELMSQGADLLKVAFEFEVNDQTYRVERTAGRRAADGARGFYFLDVDSGEWKTVPGSERRELLDQQIASVIRMSEAAFTSSFLLQQGEATQFLDAKPADRFGIISSLIGLDEYERLHKRIGGMHAEAKGALAQLTTLIAAYEGIDAHRVATLEAARDAAAVALADARLTSEVTATRAADAAAFAALTEDIGRLDAGILQADSLIVQRAVIEREAQTYARLEQDRSAVEQVRDELAAVTRAAQQAERESHAASTVDIGAAETTEGDARDAATAAEKARDAAVTAQTITQDRATTAAATLARSESIDTAQRALAGCDERIAAFDLQLAGAVDALAARDRLVSIMDTMPQLRGLREAFEAYEKVARDDPAAAVARSRSELEELEEGAPALAHAVAMATTVVQSAQQSRASADAAARTLSASIAERQAAAKEATCSRCGQPVDRKRAQAEIAELKRLLEDAAARAKTAATEVAKAERQVVVARHAESAATQRLQEVRLALSRAEDAVRTTEHAATLIEERRAAAIATAPADVSSSVTDATSSHGVVTLISDFRDVPQRLKAANAAAERLQRLDGERTATIKQREAALAAIAALTARAGETHVPLDRARSEDSRARAEAESARRTAAEAATTARVAGEAVTTSAAALVQARSQRQRHESAASAALLEAAGYRRAAEARATVLSEPHRTEALADPARLLVTLTDRATALADAPAVLAALNAAVEQRAAAVAQRSDRVAAADAIPLAHRVDAAAALAERDAVIAVANQAEATLKQAEADALRAGERLTAAADLRDNHDALAKRLRHLATLRRMLGRSGLQGALVQDALVTVTSHANAFLTRLTGGSLQLTLRRSDKSDALELRALDATCMTKSVDVLALSGSQKFRCSVAVASGIGQFVGAGGMRSVVIDEGFSSLDEQSQLQMVDELKQLANHMEKVIVVSHLEPYQDPVNFPDQIRIERRGDRSIIRRVP